MAKSLSVRFQNCQKHGDEDFGPVPGSFHSQDESSLQPMTSRMCLVSFRKEPVSLYHGVTKTESTAQPSDFDRFTHFKKRPNYLKNESPNNKRANLMHLMKKSQT